MSEAEALEPEPAPAAGDPVVVEDAQGQQWVLATPKTKDGQLQSVRIGFRAGALAALEILDSFGQKSVLSFGTFQANAALDASNFQFKPPPGAWVGM